MYGRRSHWYPLRMWLSGYSKTAWRNTRDFVQNRWRMLCAFDHEWRGTWMAWQGWRAGPGDGNDYNLLVLQPVFISTKGIQFLSLLWSQIAVFDLLMLCSGDKTTHWAFLTICIWWNRIYWAFWYFKSASVRTKFYWSSLALSRIRIKSTAYV